MGLGAYDSDPPPPPLKNSWRRPWLGEGVKWEAAAHQRGREPRRHHARGEGRRGRDRRETVPIRVPTVPSPARTS